MKYTPEQYDQKIKNWARRSPKALERGLNKATVEIIAEARAHHLNGPKMARGKTGGFMRSTLSRVTGDLAKYLNARVKIASGKITARVGTSVKSKGYSYPRAHEYGLGKMPERPFLRPSVQIQRKRTLQIISEEYIGAYKRG